MSDAGERHDHDHKIEIVKESAVLTRVEIVIPSGDVDAELNKALREVAERVTMPGFRKGHVPRKIIEQRFGRKVAREVAERLASHAFFHVVDDRKLPIVASPVFEHGEAARGKELKVVAQVEVKPEFEVRELGGLTANRPVVPVTEARVDEHLERLRRQAAQIRTVTDRAAKTGDVVRLDYTGSVDGKSNDNMRSTDVQVELGSKRFLPGFEEKMLGAERGHHAFELSIPEDFEREELRGKNVHFEVDVKDIYELVLPALDDDFAKDVDDTLENVAALRAKVREQIEVGEKDKAEQDVRQQVVEQVLEKNPFPVPPAMVERYLNAMLEEAKTRLQRRGLGPNELAALDPRRLRDEMRPQAERAAKSQLLLETLARQESIEVADDEVETKLAEIAKESANPVARVRAYYRKEGRFEQLRQQIRDEKAFAFMLERAKITDVVKEV